MIINVNPHQFLSWNSNSTNFKTSVANTNWQQRPILDGKVNFPLCLAPMVGLTHVALRLVVRDYLPAGAFTIWPTEMLNSRKIPGEDLETTPEAMRAPQESGLVPQILGNEEKHISESVVKLQHWGAEGIDINMGCPVQKALKHNYGVALMGDASYAAEVVRLTVKHSQVPVSVKLRAGTQADFEYLYRFVSGLREAGASWVSLHPRTAAQKRRGVADWEQIRKLRERVDFPVVGNGDIQTAEDVFEMLSQTGCDLTMAGRALAARPWLLWQVGERLGFQNPPEAENLNLGVVQEGQKFGADAPSFGLGVRDNLALDSGKVSELGLQTGHFRRAPQSPIEEGAEYGKCLLKLIRLSHQYFGEDLALRKVRFYIRTTAVWLLFGQTLFSIVSKAKTLQQLEDSVVQFFSNEVEMVPRTQLRE